MKKLVFDCRLRRMVRRVLTIFIVIFMTTVAAMPLVVFGAEKEKEAEINSKIQQNQSAISDAQSEKKKLTDGMKNVEAVIAGLQSKKGNLESYVTELDSNLTEIQNTITDLNSKIEALQDKIKELGVKIDEKQVEIGETKEDLEQAKAVERKQYEDTKTRIRRMYETRETTYLDVLLSAKGMQDLLNRTEYVSSMAAYDQRVLAEYAKVKEEVQEKEERLEEENAQLEQLKEDVEEQEKEVREQADEVKAQEESVSKLITAKEAEIGAYQADINSKEAQVKEYKQMIAAQDSTIKALEAAIAAQKAQLEGGEGEGNEGSGVPKYDGGKFAWPAPSYTRISDNYGNRIHPTLGVQQFHNGIDLAAPNGSPILAAYDGKVIAAAYSSTMGNYIMIDHGDGLFTIYMHASSLYVATGQSVTRGSKIAAVGSTGRSTGPHLHFSVRLNGNYVSPWNYVSN